MNASTSPRPRKHPLAGRRRHLLGALVLAVAGWGLAAPAATGVSPASTTGVSSASTTATGRLNWSACYQWLGNNFGTEQPIRYECAQQQVPLDHDAPTGATVLISLVRIPAADPSRRIGSLFLNPGGPGGSGVDFALFAGPFLYSDEVRARFDIVGFDPRGIGRSTQLRCAGNARQTSGWAVPLVWPESTGEIGQWAAADRRLQDACDQRGGRILDHMSTADVARDLDRLRAAVGDARLTYAGYSYGSYLGTTYANLFPSRVRALVVDGVLDPIAWSTGDPGHASEPFSTRLRSDIGARDTLAEFFRLCDAAAADCPFAAPGGSSARFDALERQLREHPVVEDGFVLDHRFLVGSALGAMYDSSSWWGFADFLVAIEDLAFSPTAAALATFESKRRSVGTGKSGFPRYPGFEGFAGVSCADSDNPSRVSAWAAAATARAAVSRFGPLWTWVSSPCSAWPGAKSDRFTGPWTARTASPVLVVSSRFDPATPYQGAQRVAALLPSSRLLTVEGWGHTTLFLSQAADAAVSRYLVSQTLPPAGAVFTQDLDPFAPPGAEPTSASSARAAHRARFLEQLGPWSP